MNTSLSNKKRLVFGVLLSLLSLPASLQSQLLSAYDYYPLAMGNEWIYQVLQFDPYLNVSVEGDTLLGDSLRIYEVLSEEDISYYFYNKDSTVIYQSQEFPVDINSGFPFLDTRQGLGAKWVVTYDGITRAFAIKDTVTADVFGQFRNIARVYELDVNADSIIFLEYLSTYAEGIGLIAFWEGGLIYAKINGLEYGEKPTNVKPKKREGIPKNFELRLYPNPVDKTAIFMFNRPALEQVEILIIDILGRIIRKLTTNPVSTDLYLTWDGRDKRGNALPNGIYFAIARSGDIYSTTKFTYLKR